jgi:adenosylhomocysteine nucleosidase
MSTLICFALKEEATPFRTGLRRGHHVSILLTGIGRQNAEKSLREFLLNWGARASGAQFSASRRKPSGATPEQARETRALPELVLTCGFAGGLNPEIKLGDVVFDFSARRDEFHESPIKSPDSFSVWDSWNSSLRAKLLAAGAKPAKFFCADRIATTVAEKKKLRAETGADAVEMESAAIRAVCRERGIPCATVRVISDTAGEDLPLDFNALAKPDKNLDYGKLFLAIAKSPGKIGALMGLQKKTKFAAGRLAEVLAGIIR